MILQALCNYYQRKSREVTSSAAQAIAPEGFEWKEIPYIVTYNGSGQIVALEDTREMVDGKKRARRFLIPQSVKRASNIKSNLLWDNAEYALGESADSSDSKLALKHAAFREKTEGFLKPLTHLASVKALLAMLRIPPQERHQLQNMPDWQEMLKTNSFLVFKYFDDTLPLIDQPDIVRTIAHQCAEENGATGTCLITGEIDTIAILHPPVKGVEGTQTMGGNIVSFNLSAFESYGRSKHQGLNAPTGVRAAFAYTTALNFLLSRDSRQKIRIGEATTVVFWGEKASALEDTLADILGDAYNDEEKEASTAAVRALYLSPFTGAESSRETDGSTFYVLGLAPNAARIAIRFLWQGTVTDLATNIRRHFDDLAVATPGRPTDYLPLRRILQSVSLLGKTDNIPPTLSGEVFKSVIEGTPYPMTLMNSVIQRIRAERRIDSVRASVVKACLVRWFRNNPNLFGPQGRELQMALDPENKMPAYLLGRLFAVLEKIQEEAQPSINATIRDRYFSSASATPATVFPTLLRLKNHHLRKMDATGRVVYFEKQLGTILDDLCAFPAHMALMEQGLFSVGYYHQRQSFFRPSEHRMEAN